MSFSKIRYSFNQFIDNGNILDRAYWRKMFNHNLIYPLLLPVMLLTPAAPIMAEQPLEPPSRVSVDKTAQSVYLSANQELVVTLDDNPSTGHSWELDDGNQPNSQSPGHRKIQSGFVRLVKREFQPDSDLLGAPGKLKLTFKGIGVGATALRLVHHRPGQPFEAPTKEFKVNVHTIGQFGNGISNANTLAGNQANVAVAVAEDEENVIEIIKDPVAHKRPQARTATNSLENSTTLGASTLGVSYTDPSYNACANGACTPVKNQGSCGSCWAFSTVGSFESSILKKTLVTKDLSEQYLVSCNSDQWSCNGGWFAHKYHFNKYIPGETAAGAVYESDFPYQAANVACNPPHNHYEKLVSWKYVTNSSSVPSVTAIKQAIATYGPISAAVCVGSQFQSYTGGVFSTDESASCGTSKVNHAIVLVGWDDNQGTWILRNSWGTWWGELAGGTTGSEKGYMRIKYGISNVGYAANYVSY